ncbi:MAG: UvrD-helicase domain-containing protein [Spirochaetes bacterium]|nr:UvrD-helicase domain-containing protein [Spirochaetota bacterium]
MIDKISEDILSKNVLIEASAGTGKTYTIVKLVANLIENAHALPEEIIIVTFTEKAAGEIKERIYNDLSLKLKEIDEEIRNNIDFEKEILLRKKKLINNALNNINKFLINTIHGFCNYLISNYAFEIGLNFTNEIIDDSEIIKNSFFSYLRKGLFEDIGKILNNSDKKLVVNFAEDIFSFLSFGQCTFENNNLIVDSSTEKKIYKILNYIYNISYIFPYKFRKYIFENSDEKYELLKDIGNKIDLIKIIFNKIKEFFADLKQNNQDREYTILYNFNEFVLELKDKFNDIINKINNYIEEIYPMLQDDDGSFSNNQNLGNIKKNIVDLISRIEAIERDINIHDFFSILEFKVKDSFPRYLQNKIFLFFYFLYTDILNSLVNYISINVFQLSLEYKKKCSKLSFNDMIHYVFNAINNSSILIDKLRNKFKYVFIDEFQDTDPIQWEIFRKIFISSENNNRVILIGDPKQSIYFFRNADLNTYFKAKNEIAKNGKIYKLDENFRSTAEFIDVCNKIFSSSDYFNLNIKNEKEKNISFSKNDLNIE